MYAICIILASIFIDTFLSVTYDHAAMKHEGGDEDIREYPCLVRVTDGKEVKFSTRVSVYFRRIFFLLHEAHSGPSYRPI